MEQNSSEFLVEIEELIEKIFSDLDELRETSPDQNLRRQSIDQIFRHVHSVKGLSAALGLETVSNIAHEFETLLEALRVGRASINEPVLQVCENAVDALSESLSLAASGIVEPSRRALFSQLQTAVTPQAAQSTVDTDTLLESIPSDIWESLSEGEKQRLLAVVNEAAPLFVVTANFHIASFDDEFFKLRENLAALGEVIATSPTVDAQYPDRVDFRILYASTSADVRNRIPATFTKIDRKQSLSSFDSPPPSVQTPPSVSALSNFVRTDLEKLDRLISSTYELFQTTAKALDLAGSNKKGREQLGSLNESIRSSFMGLQSELINLRMVPLGPALQRALRSGRTAARSSQKEIDFQLSGNDLRVDKVVADALADPLIHLIRNAVAHGIEPPTERERLGKPKRGTIRIEALSEGAQTTIRIADDGRGIDPQVISEAATRLGLLTQAAQPLDIDRAFRLIFRPGFTTLVEVTDVSGRGVGLDVVETAVENVGGELRVSSTAGAGSTFEIRLPVTFGLLTATVVVANGNRYCIPASQVMNVKSASPKPTKNSVELSLLLGQRGKRTGRKSRKLLSCRLSEATGNSQQTLKVIADDVEVNQEVLVRSLGRHGGRWYGVAGAAELRDGTVVLVLDLARLRQAAAG